jgi:DNA-binding CsgD family transcriptional regulator
MKHIQILFLVVNLIFGTSLILYINNLRRKYNNVMLRYLVLYLLSFNIFVFVDFNYKYTLYIIYGSNFDSLSKITGTIFYVIISLAEFGIVYYLYLTVVSLMNNVRSRFVIYSIVFLFLVYCAGSIIGITRYFLNSDEKWIYVVHMFWIFSFIVLIFFILSKIYIFSRTESERSKKNLLSSFAIIFSIGYLLFALSNFDFYIIKIHFTNLDPLIFAVINLSPFIWLKFFFVRVSVQKTDTTISDSFQKVIADFNISERECEVVRLITEGKSNKEIENLLNISFNTVKNHIYNVYRKINVNSRSQLIRFIYKYKGNDD